MEAIRILPFSISIYNAVLAQLARALHWYCRGHWFESSRRHHILWEAQMDNTIDHLSKMAEGMLGEVETDMIESVYDLFHSDAYKPTQEQDNEDQSTLRR